MAATSQQVGVTKPHNRKGWCKALRLVKIARLLDEGGEYSSTYLAEMFGVLPDTIADDMDELDVYLHIPTMRRVQVEVWWSKLRQEDGGTG